jgi:hypothetical protein
MDNIFELKLTDQTEMEEKRSSLDLPENNQQESDYSFITNGWTDSDVFKADTQDNTKKAAEANMQQNVLVLIIRVALISIIASALFCSFAKLPALIFLLTYTCTFVALILILCVYLCLLDRIKLK